MDNFKTGLSLYKLFKTCLEEGKDPARLNRLQSRLDDWYGALTQPQKYQFCAILVKSGLITGILAKAIATFDAALVEMPEEVTF